MGKWIHDVSPDWAKVVELLEAGADPDEVNDFGMNLLHLLADNGGEVEKKQNYKKYLPLILKKILLIGSADVNHHNSI